ncbi:MAG: tetratricopeptide repeat protein [Deltaproteobacteria bacterium]|nr:tetratricopeptide repeat protein [Deltaproteobacteria bacterium]
MASIALAAPGALGQTQPDGPTLTEAQQLYDRGRALYQEGRYEEAVVELEHALALDPSASVLLYNIGLVYEKLGQFDRSVEFLRRYLEAEIPPEERARIEATIRRIEGASTHHREATPETRIVQVPVPVPVLPRRQDTPSFGRADTIFFVTAGAAVVALGAAAVTGALALSEQSAVERFVVGDDGDLEGRDALAANANDFALASDVSLISAGVLAVGATLLYALRRADRPDVDGPRPAGSRASEPEQESPDRARPSSRPWMLGARDDEYRVVFGGAATTQTGSDRRSGDGRGFLLRLSVAVGAGGFLAHFGGDF